MSEENSKPMPGFAPRLAGLSVDGAGEGRKTADCVRILFEDAVAANSSDVHLDPRDDDYRVRFRVDGALHDVGSLPRPLGERFLRYLRGAADLEPMKPYEPKDGHLRLDLNGAPWELRLASVPTPAGETMALRLLNPERLERRLDQLGMAPPTLRHFEYWLEDSTGMILVAGPTGSGKTSTLYALLHELRARPRSIVTIEDPVEYELEGVTQIQVKESAGLTFAEGLKSMLRLDPDYLMIGEIRDEESAEAAVDAAGAGHLLLGTLHSRDAVGAITMLRNYGIEDHKIAAALELVVAQRLVRQLCEKCRVLSEPSKAEDEWLRRNGLPAAGRCWRAPGCEACQHTGYHGRLGVFEVWRIGEDIERLILDHADELTLRHAQLEDEHPILLRDGYDKMRAGLTSLHELQRMRAGSQSFLLRDGTRS